MELEHHFTVPVPTAQAWEALLDVERIAPCMPGATVDSFDGETIDGKVKVKVGPIQVTYAGTAKFVEKDAASHRAVIEARARESRGAGTAAATITTVLTDAGSATDVTVTTDLQITGKPAQFGRGVLADVGDKILGKFAVCLAEELAQAAPTATATDDDSVPVTPLPSEPVENTFNLLDSAWPAVLKRVAPLVGGLILLLVIWRIVGRRRG
jgi:carbon monoxide dehydrogenase subunit G